MTRIKFFLCAIFLIGISDAYAQEFPEAQDSLTYRETQQLLDLSRKEQLILQQQAELQRVELAAGKQRQWILIGAILINLFVILTLVILVVRSKRASKIITEQNRTLARQQRNLQHAQMELKKTLRIARGTSVRLQKSNTRLKNMQSQLIHAEKMSSLGQLTAGIVHEINNPVNFVKGGIEMLEKSLGMINDLFHELKDAENEKAGVRSVDEIQKEIREELQFSYEITPQIIKDVKFGTARISEIVNGLRIFSRQGEAVSTSIGLHELIDSALLILRNKYTSKADLEKNYDAQIEKIECYPGLLNQVFVNILSNAIDAIDDKGKIIIDTMDSDDFVLIKITDNGSGIEKEHLDHIFEPFFTTKEVGKGTGIGLSISYSIIKKHMGTIEVSCEPGLYTSFTIKLKKKLDLRDEISEGVIVEGVRENLVEK